MPKAAIISVTVARRSTALVSAEDQAIEIVEVHASILSFVLVSGSRVVGLRVLELNRRSFFW